MHWHYWLGAVALFAAPLLSADAAAAASSDDEAAIRRCIEAYVVAYEQGDAKALAELWSPSGVYVSFDTREPSSGRAEIEAEFRRLFSQPDKRTLKVDVRSIRFVTADVAIEDGTVSVSVAGGEPTTSNYTAIHVKKDGRWLLDSVRETESTAPAATSSPLKQVAWLVGRWIDEEPNATVTYDCRWSKNEAFLISNFTIVAAGGVDIQGTQIIGWDPAEQSIRSWVFDSDSGFGTGLWNRAGDEWIVKMQQVLPDGSLGSMTNVYEIVDSDTYRWSSTDRRVGDSELPAVGPVRIVRARPTSESPAAEAPTKD